MMSLSLLAGRTVEISQKNLCSVLTFIALLYARKLKTAEYTCSYEYEASYEIFGMWNVTLSALLALFDVQRWYAFSATDNRWLVKDMNQQVQGS